MCKSHSPHVSCLFARTLWPHRHFTARTLHGTDTLAEHALIFCQHQPHASTRSPSALSCYLEKIYPWVSLPPAVMHHAPEGPVWSAPAWEPGATVEPEDEYASLLDNDEGEPSPNQAKPPALCAYCWSDLVLLSPSHRLPPCCRHPIWGGTLSGRPWQDADRGL